MKILKTVFPVLIAFAIGFVLYRLIDFKNLIVELEKANVWLIIIPCFILLFAHFLRAVRMNLLLRAVGYQPSVLNTSLAVVVGYFANLLLPRMGEITRCTIIQRTEHIPANISIGVVVTERIVDLICVLICLVLCLYMEYAIIYDFVISILPFKKDETWKLLLILLGISLFFIVFYILSKKYLKNLITTLSAKKFLHC